MVQHCSCLEQKKQLEAKGRNESMKWKDERESNQEVLIKLQQTLRVSELLGNPMC